MTITLIFGFLGILLSVLSIYLFRRYLQSHRHIKTEFTYKSSSLWPIAIKYFYILWIMLSTITAIIAWPIFFVSLATNL